MAQKFKKSQKVQWKWLGKSILGQILEVFHKSVTKTIKGKKITRHGSEDNPAYLVRSEAGNQVLKLQSEISVAKQKTSKTKSSSPSLFS